MVYLSYNNILFSSEAKTTKEQDPFVQEHVLTLITSGSMDFYTGDEVVVYPAGTLGLLKRNQLVKVIKRADAEKPFSVIYIHLDQEVLKKFSEEYEVSSDSVYVSKPNILLDLDPFFKTYFDGLSMYCEQPDKLTPAIANIKTLEVITLLIRNPALKNLLFDFSQPHKVDLEAYMNKYYFYNVSLLQFATLTARSLSTFKRDFVKIFQSTPEKWLQKRRLDMAYFLISQKNKRPSDVYLEVGFENFSHFSTAFKKSIRC